MKKCLITTAKVFLYFVGWAVLFINIPIPDFENPAIWRFWAELTPFLSIVGVSILFWLIEKRKIQVFPASNFLKSCLFGIIGGLIWLGLTLGMMFVAGVFEITEIQTVPMLWLWIFSALLNTIMQELLVRGYLYQMIKAKYHMAAATIVSTALFTLMHGGAFEAGIIPVLNIFTMSLLMTFVLEYTRSLVAPILMHFLWNSVGAIILGGVSLAEDYPHLCTAAFHGNKLLSGGVYKMEGSIVVLILNLAFICFVLFLMKRKKNA